jgi:CheY-like chemotaxis protein/HPt (histidine-containing phosphotransfer) domain-containing protein
MGRRKKITQVQLPDREKFLINLSHQIRTPLNAISGLAEILQFSGLDQTQRDYLTHIQAATGTLSSLINNLLEFARLEQNTLVLKEEDFSIEDMIVDVINLHQPIIAEKKLTVNYFIDREIPTTLKGDLGVIQILINNIVNNAVKFTYSGKVDIRVNHIQNNIQSVIIEIKVQDTGIGIPKDKIPHLFDPSDEYEVDYTQPIILPALGLQVSKQFAALMHGTIDVESTEGKGSIFTVMLQLKKSNTETATAKPQQISDDIFFKNLHVLLVEDNKINQIVTQKILQLHGIIVDIAENGQVAIDMISQKSYDLLLMDLQMPVMDGYTTTDFIRNTMSAPISKVPIIAYTAHAFQGEEQKCLARGMNDYISKPLNTEQLLKKIAALVPDKTSTYKNSEAAVNNKLFKNDDIDLSYLHELSHGNQGFVNEIIETFLEETPNEFIQAHSKLGEANFDEIYKIIHKIKPSFALMGMHSASQAIAEIEYQCKNSKDLIKITDAMNRLQKLIERAIPHLKSQVNA